jgi:hypothetical protein
MILEKIITKWLPAFTTTILATLRIKDKLIGFIDTINSFYRTDFALLIF